MLSISSQQMHLRPVPAITKKNNKKGIIAQEMWKKEKKGEQAHRGRQEETEKELYHVYYAPASEFKCVRLRWNRAGVIIISYCLLDRTLK